MLQRHYFYNFAYCNLFLYQWSDLQETLAKIRDCQCADKRRSQQLAAVAICDG